MIPQVSPDELKEWLQNTPDLFLLDVREPWEHEATNIGGLLAPVGEVAAYIDQIPDDRTVVVYCAHGGGLAAFLE
jgi:rhodanese-related sulfurtransferase